MRSLDDDDDDDEPEEGVKNAVLTDDDDDDDDGGSCQNRQTPQPAGETPYKSRKLALESVRSDESSKKLITELKHLYKSILLPIEAKYQSSLSSSSSARSSSTMASSFGGSSSCFAPIQEEELDSKPIVLLLGQYSTGKTTFLQHVLGQSFPGMHIGPEPTTDRFMALLYNNINDNDKNKNNTETNEQLDTSDNPSTHSSTTTDGGKITTPKGGKVIKGNTLTVTPDLPFSSLSCFGTSFLSHFVGSVSSAPLLRNMILIDTPGILAGEKQRLNRTYDFAHVTKWFADRADLILLLFDAHKLDISDELKEVMTTIQPNNDDKIRCILNKSDSITSEQLVRVYGSLLWSMGKIFQSPEVVRVYTGSYWQEPLRYADFEHMFTKDETLLLEELVHLPATCAERKVNEMVKRIRLVKVNLCIFSYLKRQTPRFFWKQSSRHYLMNNLPQVFEKVRHEYGLSQGDFPPVLEFRERLEQVQDFSSFQMVDNKTLQTLDDLIVTKIPSIIRSIGGVSGLDNASKKKKKKGINEEKGIVSGDSETMALGALDKVTDVKGGFPWKSFLPPLLIVILAIVVGAIFYDDDPFAQEVVRVSRSGIERVRGVTMKEHDASEEPASEL